MHAALPKHRDYRMYPAFGLHLIVDETAINTPCPWLDNSHNVFVQLRSPGIQGIALRKTAELDPNFSGSCNGDSSPWRVHTEFIELPIPN